MNEDIKTRASLNAVGNGALGGPMGNAGTGTGLQAGMGCDIGMDATNSMGSITADTLSCMPMEASEESYQFSAPQLPMATPGRMGSLNLGD